jgi:ATP-dependent protease ClpP protease subunit
MKIDWFHLSHDAATGTAHVGLFDDIGCDQGRMLEDFTRQLADSKPTRIKLRIDSTGGDGFTALALIQLLRPYPTEVLVLNRCWSAALVLAVGAANYIRATANATFLIHSPVGWAFGPAEHLFQEAEKIKTLSSSVRDLFCQRTKLSPQAVSELMSKESWPDAAQCEALGLIDEIVELPTPPRRERVNGEGVTAKPMTESEKLFRTWISAFGEVTTTDKAALVREVQQFCATQIRELPTVGGSKL